MEKVNLHGFEYWKQSATLTGITPLLQHAPTAMRPAGTSGRTKNIPTAEDEAARAVYRNADGNLFLQAIAVRNCMLNGASRGDYRIGKKSLKALLSAGLMIEPVEIPLLRNGAPISEYEIDIRRAVVQRNAVLRARPLIAVPWEAQCDVLVDAGLFTLVAGLSQIQDLFSFAGRFIGVGDYRPEKTGWFGQFAAVLE